ncbi:restriction endonuclease subunit S, partial [Pseudomonas aeruginosa]
MKTVEVCMVELERYELREGDVLMTEGVDFHKLGLCTVWRGQVEVCLHQKHVFAVRSNESLLLP